MKTVTQRHHAEAITLYREENSRPAMMITENLTPRAEISEQKLPRAHIGASARCFRRRFSLCRDPAAKRRACEKNKSARLFAWVANIRLSGNPTKP